MRKLCLPQVDLCFDHHSTKWMPRQFPLFTLVELVTWTFKNILEGPNKELRHANTLTPDGYQNMLNTKLLGKEGVLFILYQFVVP
jgi:hypothetical protein